MIQVWGVRDEKREMVMNENATAAGPGYDFPLCKLPATKPLPAGKGMTDEEAREAHEAYLRALANDE